MDYIFKQKIVKKSNKEYVCELCGEVIAKGSSYIRWNTKEDGDFYTLRKHRHCHSITKKIFEPQEVLYLDQEEFRERVAEYYKKIKGTSKTTDTKLMVETLYNYYYKRRYKPKYKILKWPCRGRVIFI